MISKLLQARTTPAIFLPMSCTSPLTVASTMRPAVFALPALSFSMAGCRCATAFFMTRALLTTWGRNILPEPKRSPTWFMPAMSGPSMMESGRGYFFQRLFEVCFNEIRDALDQGVGKAFFDGAVAPGEVFGGFLAAVGL
jgi:hypothetical protein